MARRRPARRLGSPSLRHRTKLRADLKDADRLIGAAAAYLHAGRCNPAMNALANAEALMSSADSEMWHVADAGKLAKRDIRASDSQARRLGKAWGQFRKSCVLQKGR